MPDPSLGNALSFRLFILFMRKVSSDMSCSVQSSWTSGLSVFTSRSTPCSPFRSDDSSHTQTCALLAAHPQATPLVAGVAVAASALAAKYGIEAYQAWRLRPVAARARRFYEGGFQPMMTKREAALILGIR